ncbi:MAG: peptidoglycan DD-metalloendopeptidase family protein [bacterium]|nr:peptidoglycan DD-metalloendopeptidase family protein [bacterium]
MKNTFRFAVPFVLSTFLFAPLFAAAQTTTSDYSRYSEWRRQSNEFQQKIDALGTVAEQNVPMPILFGPVNNLHNYGELRVSGRTHEGLDLMSPKGTPIVSPTAAVVTRIDYGAGEGNAVYTANPGGERFIYYHLDRVAEGIAAGQVLARGDLIGYVGNTGDASGGAAHLHFEIRTSSGNTPSDPFPRLTLTFTPEEQMAYLSKILTQAADPNTLAQFLVTNFRPSFTAAISRGVSVPPLISALIAPQSSAAPPTSTPISTSTQAFVFTRNLYFGIGGEDVRALQQALNRNGYVVAAAGPGSLGQETAYFGPATRAAVIKYQLVRGISPSVGYVGVLTRASFALLRM